MPQLEIETGRDGATATRKEAESHWLNAEEPAPASITPWVEKLSQRRQRGWVANAVLVALIVSVPPMAILFGVGAQNSASAVWIGATNALRLGPATSHNDRLLGGLLADSFDEGACHSRFQSATYRRNARKKPSAYLVTKLRQQEALQRRCGPGTAAYSNALEQLRSGKKQSYTGGECRYLMSISYQGLGNRILAATSAFLYAMLTDRVLLVDPSNQMGDLFCEPFPNTTWLLPQASFPLTNYSSFNIDTAESYANMLKNKVFGASGNEALSMTRPAFAYIHLNHDASDQDKLFFCDEDQRNLRDFQWLVMRTDNYIVPGLFLITAFQEELDQFFPEPDTVFHHLGRYLFHPNNNVWGLITRYYDAYLATAHQRVGIQVRVFGKDKESPKLLEQITTCTQKESLLPELGEPADRVNRPAARKSTKAVLVTSLKAWYYEKLKSMYWEHSTVTGEAVSLHQPSHEEYQQFAAKSHDAKAWAEIYLLSLSDALVTTGLSTFGYVAQGLGGLTPWVMYKPANGSVVPNPPCGHDVSMEPCFLQPAFYDCRTKQAADVSNIVPHVQRCNDTRWGLKLVPRTV